MALLATLLYPPPTGEAGLEEFWHANLQHHQAIIGALGRTRGVQLSLFNLYPVTGEDFKGFLRQHQDQHNAMNAVLGIPSVDLTDLDMDDKKKLDAWLFIHFTQHQVAAQLCGEPV